MYYFLTFILIFVYGESICFVNGDFVRNHERGNKILNSMDVPRPNVKK